MGVSVNNMIAMVQCYIHILKNVQVTIVIRDTRDVFLLADAYKTAMQFFEDSNAKIIQL